jgi:hypothetical protein
MTAIFIVRRAEHAGEDAVRLESNMAARSAQIAFGFLIQFKREIR